MAGFEDWQRQAQQQQQNPFNAQQSQTQQPSQTQPSWTQPSTSTTSSGGAQQGSIYNQYTQPSQAPSQQNNWASDIAGAYQKYLGRAASQQEINDRVTQKNFNLGTHVNSIQNSAEAQAYAQRQAQQPPQGAQQTQQPQWRSDQAPASEWQRFTPPPAPWTGGGVVPPGYGGMPPTQGSQRPMQLPSDPRGWNTDNYPKPGYVAQQPSRNPPAGWEASKWNDPNHQTPKYVIGRILSQYQPSIQGLAAAAQEIARAYPGASFNGKDKVTVPGLDTFDLLANSGSGNNMRWQLGAQGDASAGARGGKPQAQAPAQQDQYTQLLNQLGAAQGNGPMYHYTSNAAAAADPAQGAQMQALQQQLAAMMQQFQTQQAEAAKKQAQGPQFNYY